MTHDCRIGYLEVSEDVEGYLYIEWKKAFGSNAGPFNIEYCPVCGMKAKNSKILQTNLFPRQDMEKDPLEHMHQIIMQSFFDSCVVLIKEDLNDHSFQFCLDTINNTLIYVK